MQWLAKILGAASIVALTLGAVAESSAETGDLPDRALCVNALNRERSAWNQNSIFSMDVAEAKRRGHTIDACRQLIAQPLSPPTHAEEADRLKPYADKSHPSFLEAGIFFMTGHEPPDRVKFQLRPDGVVSALVKRLMLEPGRAAYDAIWEFKLSLDKPCTIMAYKIQPPYAIERLEFLNVPSPRAMRTDPKYSPYRADIMDLPHETWCHAKAYMNEAGAIDLVKNTTMCDTGIAIGQAYDAHRRLAALDYIRANFCPGQPEPPPPPPPKPY